MNAPVNEFTSFKLLLKQVYSAHTTKVKELENQVKNLKEQMAIKNRDSKSISDCKRCVELESAFKSCQKALQEQSKFFDTFGAKFSIFNDSEKGSLESKHSSSQVKTDFVHCDVDLTVSSKKETTLLPLQDSISVQNFESKISTTSNQNILEKVMFDDGNNSTFDVCTVTFPHNIKNMNFSKKFDDTIFAPDSLEMDFDSKKGIKRRSTDCFSEDDDPKISNFEFKNISEKEVEIIRRQKLNPPTENHIKNSTKYIKPLDTEINKPVSFDIKLTKISNSKKVNSEFIADKNEFDTSTKSYETQLKTKDEAEIPKEKESSTPKAFSSTLVNNITKIASPYETSPSLLPKNDTVPKKINLETIVNDNDDFIENASSSSKSYQSDDCTEVSGRQKSRKKNRPRIKCSSKYKMTLDAPPLNYKKPSFKQSKLSKSFFQGKKNKESCDSKRAGKVKESHPKKGKQCIPTIVLDELQTSNHCDTARTPDIDATFIPEDYKIDSIPLGTKKVVKKGVGISNFRNGSLFSSISFLENLNPEYEHTSSAASEIKTSPSTEDNPEFKENSFDKLPVPKEPNYKYQNDVVRKKAERKLLDGFDCNECEKYYSDLGLSDKEKKERMKKCSRHRGKFAPPATPDHFWELDFPDTQECKIRGYMDATQKVKLNQLGDI